MFSLDENYDIPHHIRERITERTKNVFRFFFYALCVFFAKIQQNTPILCYNDNEVIFLLIGTRMYMNILQYIKNDTLGRKGGMECSCKLAALCLKCFL